MAIALSLSAAFSYHSRAWRSPAPRPNRWRKAARGCSWRSRCPCQRPFRTTRALGVVLRHAPTVGVKLPEVVHGARVVLVSGLFVPLARLGVVPPHALTVVVKRAEVVHGARVALVSGLFVPLARLA